MPQQFAARLAQQLAENETDYPVVIDVPNDGFNEAVATELEKLGYYVDRDPFSTRLTIKGSANDSKN
ncbi:MAG TPA: hypothetical protein VMI31_10930 [Fimbriimonadaceae bacterium]|nr:hypothetical protein [Fimbriimonadaceae bacterium]